MAVNSGNTRKGAVKKRTQVYNAATGHFIKRDAESGQFLEVKKDGTKFKGVRVEKTIFKANPSITKSIAEKAEKAVIALQKKKNGE